MTDRPDSPRPPDPGAAEPPEAAEVRRLLAEARHTEPMPPDVVARMEQVIAGLGDQTAGQPADPPPHADVVPITAYRRRRAVALLVGAAAVVVGGIALGPHLPHGGSDSPAGSSAGGSTVAGKSNNFGNTGSDQSQNLAPARHAPVRDGRVVVRPQQFPSAALRGRRLLKLRTHQLDTNAVSACSGLPAGATAVPAEYRHAPAALVYRRAVGSAQVVDLYVCGSTRPIRSTTLPAP